MNCITKMLVAVAFLKGVCGCGAEQSGEAIARAKFTGEIKAIGEALVNEGVKYPHQEIVTRINVLMAGISNQTWRAEAARSYAQMLKDAELGALPYRKRGKSVMLYGRYVLFAFRVMIKNGVDPKESMELFFACMEKYRTVCSSVSADEKIANERPDECKIRKECVLEMKESYSYTVSIINRFWLPSLSDYLPPEHHEDFKQRIAPFLIE